MEKLENDTEKIDFNRFSNGCYVTFWDQINIIFYALIPFLVMVTTNLLLIFKLRQRKLTNYKTDNGQKRASHKRQNLTISLLIISFLFVLMTSPGSILFGFFYNQILGDLDRAYIFLIDDISFLNHASLFFISFASNMKFRKAVIEIYFRCLSRPKK